jgi:heavy metal translocating P-type ATPase
VKTANPNHPITADPVPSTEIVREQSIPVTLDNVSRDRVQDRAEMHEHEHHGIETIDAVLIAFAAIVSALRFIPFAGYKYVALAAVLFCGYPIYREAFESIRERRMTMELSMTIALVAALTIGEFFTALMIVLFVLVAEVIEGLTVGRGRRAIKDLLELLPHTVEVRNGDKEETIELDHLHSGSIVVVKPGSRIPVDGTVLAGSSFVDESAITGESMPVEKLPGGLVYAGAVNQSGALELEVQAVGHDTAFGRIIEAVEQAERSRAPIQKTADRLAGYLVYFALACALVTFLVTRNVRSTISVIIVAGACGIAAGTPLAILGGIGRAAKGGVIIKGGLFLEVLGRVTTVVLDKTGTLTIGKPRVVDVLCEPGVTREELLATAAIAESRSEHALATAILDESRKLGISVHAPDTFQYTPGRGVEVTYQGNRILAGNRKLMLEAGVQYLPKESRNAFTEISVEKNGKLLGTICISDTLRPEAAKVMQDLKSMGLETILLSGDTAPAVEHTAGKAGFDAVYSDLLPTEKSEHVRQLTASGKTVAMVGDGINDALALIEANVGVAMGSGTDVARESADALLLGNNLSRLVDTLQIARRCRRIIMANFVGTLAVDAVGVGLAAFGFLNPLLAVSIHVLSELAFILNSARLLPGRTPGRAAV